MMTIIFIGIIIIIVKNGQQWQCLDSRGERAYLKYPRSLLATSEHSLNGSYNDRDLPTIIPRC